MHDRLQTTIYRILTAIALQARIIMVDTFESSDSNILKTLDWLDRLLDERLESGDAGWNLLVRFSLAFMLTLYYTDIILELMLGKFSNYYPVMQCSVLRPNRQPEFTSYLLVIARIAPINRHIDMNITLTCEPSLSYDKGVAYS